MPYRFRGRMFLVAMALASAGGCVANGTDADEETAATEEAARPSPPEGTISLVLLNSTDGLPHVGQKVTFDVSTTATLYPFVTLDCYQGATWVSHASNGIFPTSLSEIFTLASSSWMSGGAQCTAYLQNWDAY